MSTQDRKYPRKVWVLAPSYKPMKVEVVKRGWLNQGDETANNKLYLFKEMHETRSDAIAYGRELIADRRKRVVNQMALIEKHEKELAKADQ